MTATTSTEQHIDTCRCHLYDAECALHAAHQSHVPAWIDAAQARLHDRVVEYLAAVAETDRQCMQLASRDDY
jgi:hypothetical protein